MEKNAIRIAITDDHATLRRALMYSLSGYPSLKIVFDAANGEELLEKLEREQPDVLLLDIKMPNLSGIEALKVIHSKYPNVRTLMLTGCIDEVYVAQCLKYGVNGYLTKDMDIEEIVQAILMAHDNKVYSNNLLKNALFRNYLVMNRKNANDMLPDFSEEEITILDLLRCEKTTEEISQIMNLSKRSIEIKRDKMREKANVKTVGGLLLYATKRNMLE